MSSTLIVQYLGQGLAANRPTTPAIDANAIGFYAATDTGALSSYYNGAWHTFGTGTGAGTPPSIVQVAHSIAGGNSVTMGVAPTNGNLLVCMNFNPTSSAAGAGWTNIFTDSSGTDFGLILTKTAGVGESTTQTPGSGWNGTASATIIWELHGVTAGPLIKNSSGGEQSGSAGYVPALPIFTNTLWLGAIGLVSSVNNVTQYVAHSDAHDTSGANRQLSAGHATLADAGTGAMAEAFSGSSSYKSLGIVVG